MEPGKPADQARTVPLPAGLRVSRVAITDEGILDITFSDGTALITGPDPDYEAWNLCSNDGEKAICLPAGGTAYWSSLEAQ
jgi:hypothetical protein